MGKIAFLFAGQGSQYPGMGKELYEEIPEVREFFDAAEQIRPGTLQMMFEGTEDELKQTANTQPCLFLVDVAAAMALRKNGIEPDMAAGFSLGEIAALAISGILSGEEAFRLVCRRGELMQEAAGKVKGSMIAVLRAEQSELEALCEECGVYPVNYNCPGQIVVSGSEEKIETLKTKLSEAKTRFVELPVSGPFHTPYMQTATEGLEQELIEGGYESMKKADLPLYANRTAQPYPESKEAIVEILSKQISHSVRWEETLRNMAAEGVDCFVECGPGTTLSGFVKRTLKDVKICNVCDKESLQKTIEGVKEGC